MQKKYADDYMYTKKHVQYNPEEVCDRYNRYKEYGKNWNLAHRAALYGRDIKSLKPDEETSFSIKPHSKY
jgi:hypothetical protein